MRSSNVLCGLLVSLALIGTCMSQTYPPTLPDQILSIPNTNVLCNTNAFQTSPWAQTNFTPYVASVQPKGVCYISNAIEPCATLSGAAGCNKYNAKCESINQSVDFTSTTLHPEIAAVMSERPSVCISQGAFYHPDAIVFSIVLIIVGVLLSLALLIYVLHSLSVFRVGILLNLVIVASFILSILLLFSYYYLNAVLCVACVYVAYTLFSVRRPECSAFGFFILLGGMLWTMHASALGWVQHMSRFSAGATDASITMCINYYRGYFAYPMELRGDFDNPILNSRHFCRRKWLGAELFFMILFQLVMLLAVVAGGVVRTTFMPVRQVKISEMDQHDSA